jgi:galactokinase/mevalonate kinase-like predicted kinase
MAGDDSESLEVEITNSNGLNIWKQSVSLDNHSAKLSLNAASGVYMVIVTNPKTKQRVIKKLVIQK